MVNELLAEIENRRMSDDIDVLSNKSTMDFDMSDSQRHFDESMSAMKQVSLLAIVLYLYANFMFNT